MRTRVAYAAAASRLGVNPTLTLDALNRLTLKSSENQVPCMRTGVPCAAAASRLGVNPKLTLDAFTLQPFLTLE